MPSLFLSVLDRPSAPINARALDQPDAKPNRFVDQGLAEPSVVDAQGSRHAGDEAREIEKVLLRRLAEPLLIVADMPGDHLAVRGQKIVQAKRAQLTDAPGRDPFPAQGLAVIERVAAAAALQQQHAEARARQRDRQCRTGRSCTDDRRVETLIQRGQGAIFSSTRRASTVRIGCSKNRP
jgi:hypothetical protein